MMGGIQDRHPDRPKIGRRHVVSVHVERHLLLHVYVEAVARLDHRDAHFIEHRRFALSRLIDPHQRLTAGLPQYALFIGNDGRQNFIEESHWEARFQYTAVEGRGNVGRRNQPLDGLVDLFQVGFRHGDRGPKQRAGVSPLTRGVATLFVEPHAPGRRFDVGGLCQGQDQLFAQVEATPLLSVPFLPTLGEQGISVPQVREPVRVIVRYDNLALRVPATGSNVTSTRVTF